MTEEDGQAAGGGDVLCADAPVVVALNAGSSSVKFGVFAQTTDGLVTIARGTLDDVDCKPGFRATDASGEVLTERRLPSETEAGALIASLLDWVESHVGPGRLSGIGHRVVHGGSAYDRPIRIDEDVLARLDELTPLAPLHQPRSLQPIRIVRELRPDLKQVACFDTAFHRNLEPPVSRYAIPRRYEEQGVRKYGFHGLSYEFVAGRLRERALDLADARLVVAHLGRGASLCALRSGRSVDTTMGFSALDGLVMGTRCGALDAGIVLYLQQEGGLDVEEVEDLLYRRSGLLGVSGISADLQDLSASDDPNAREAVDLFAFRTARETAAMTNTLEGLDGFVFTGGIGEHSPVVRAEVCERLHWLGVEMDGAANEAGVECISASHSKVQVLVIPTNEEIVVAAHAFGVLEGWG